MSSIGQGECRVLDEVDAEMAASRSIVHQKPQVGPRRLLDNFNVRI